jgi:O6-methylguanine-DNA--protein-cysteine methyltransferase
MEVPNADKDLAKYNSRPIGSADLNQDIQKRLQEAGITTTRKNAVLGVEHLITASPDAFSYQVVKNNKGEKELRGDVQKWKEFQEKSLEWLSERYGRKNIVNFTVHKDESTPHIHAIVVPIDSKGNLNCKSFLGGRDKMREMQTSFAQKVQHLGLERGIEGSKAIHQDVKRFYQVINQEPQFISLEKIEIKTPEKGMLGIGYKQDPAELAKEETERVNKLLQEAAQKANKSLLAASAFDSKAKVDQNKYRGLEATLKRFKTEKDQALQQKTELEKKVLEEKRKHWNTIEGVAKGEITPEIAKKWLEQAKIMEQQKQKQIHSKRGGSLGI